jgi:hypothetical protein
MSNTPVPNDAEEKVPRRYWSWDWLILPVLSLLTLGCVAETFRIVNRQFFSEYSWGPKCISYDLAKGVQATPYCSCWTKSPETQTVEYRFNSCGHRTEGVCGVKTPGTYRIVLIGSSFAMGFGVPIQSGFAALMPEKLSKETGRKVEIYNEALSASHPHGILLLYNEVLSAHPNMILWTVTPRDIEKDPEGEEQPFRGDPGILGQIKWGVAQDLTAKPLWQVTSDMPGILRNAVSDSHIGFPLQHILYESQSEYVRLSLLEGRSAGFLRTKSGPYWDARMVQVDDEVAKMIARAHAAGVPFAAVLLPSRVQAAMISMGQWPAGYDPYKLDNELRMIVTSHGGIYLDILPAIRDIPNPEQDYLPVDGHLDARGQAIFADLIARQLTSGAVPELRAAGQVPTNSQNEMK